MYMMWKLLSILVLCFGSVSCWSDKSIQMHVNAANAVVNATNGTQLMLEDLRVRDVAACGSDTNCSYRINTLYRPAVEAVYYFELALEQWRNGIVLYQASKDALDFDVMYRAAGLVVIAFDSMLQVLRTIGVNPPPMPGLRVLCLIVDPEAAKRSALCGSGFKPSP